MTALLIVLVIFFDAVLPFRAWWPILCGLLYLGAIAISGLLFVLLAACVSSVVSLVLTVVFAWLALKQIDKFLAMVFEEYSRPVTGLAVHRPH